MQGIIISSMRPLRKSQEVCESDPADVLTGRVHAQGIVFSVRPPKKSWKNIANLSGGEKTLSSLSLVFALHHYKPTPLYVMDEIDAALGRLHPLQQALPQRTIRRLSCDWRERLYVLSSMPIQAVLLPADTQAHAGPPAPVWRTAGWRFTSSIC